MNLAEAGAPPPEPGKTDVTRRRVLAAIAGGVGLAVLPKFPAYAQSGQSVAIVGGGLAGLAALDELRRRGVDATLFEARGAAGGRTRSVQGVFADNYAFDEGGQLVNSDHADLLGMISRYRIRIVDRRAFGPSHEVQIGRNGARRRRSAARRCAARHRRPDHRRFGPARRRLCERRARDRSIFGRRPISIATALPRATRATRSRRRSAPNMASSPRPPRRSNCCSTCPRSTAAISTGSAFPTSAI